MKKPPSPPAGQVRIIGGQWRGRKLPVPDKSGLRPTTDRVRETLFNWLAPWIAGARCLDCFAGSGALGFEALSRHAAQVTLLESDPDIVRQLKKNLTLFASGNGFVVQGDAQVYLTQPARLQNIVFVDPPFHQGLLSHTLHLLETRGWLAENALIYVESEREYAALPVPAGWKLQREKTAGQVIYRLYLRHHTVPSGMQ